MKKPLRKPRAPAPAPVAPSRHKPHRQSTVEFLRNVKKAQTEREQDAAAVDFLTKGK